MEYVDVDLVLGERWLFPLGARLPITQDGFLDDPAGPHAYLTRTQATRLAALEAVPAVVLYGESGLGKSTVLRAEAARRRTMGDTVALIDVAGLDPQGIRDEINNAFAGAEGEIVLILDGFDQTLLGDLSPGRVIRAALEPLRQRVSQVVIAARRGLWDNAIEDSLPTWAPTRCRYALAPLTLAQVRYAAGTVLEDPEGFIAKVLAAEIGAMAAHPISLRLLLQAARREELPATRMEVYRLGSAGLAEEHNPARLMDPPLDARLAAAQRLATATLLSGVGQVCRRRRAGQVTRTVALEEVVHPPVFLDALEGSFRSSLLQGDEDRRSWMHRSIEEFLCAEQLAALPMRTAENLLEHPSAPGTLRPQFAGVAAWLATFSGEWFQWVLSRRYEVLFNPDLPFRSPAQRRQLALTLAAHIGSDDLPYIPNTDPDSLRSSLDYGGLAYDGIEADLAKLLDVNQPPWRTREALLVVIANDLRGLDEQLLALIEHAAERFGSEDYGPEIQVGVYAAIALRGCTEPSLIARAKALAAGSTTPWMLRAELLRWLLPPYHMSIAELSTTIPPAERKAGQGAFGRTLAAMLVDETRMCNAEDLDLLRFIAESPSQVRHMDRVAEAGADLILSVIDEADPDDEVWHQAARLTSLWISESPHRFRLTAADCDNMDPQRRRQFARDVLLERGGGVQTRRMIGLGLIQPSDLAWWLNELAIAIAADTPTIEPAEVVDQLARNAPSIVALDEMYQEATALVVGHPPMQAFVETHFGTDAPRRHIALAVEPDDKQFGQRSQPTGRVTPSAERLDAALATGEPQAILDHLYRELPGADNADWAGLGPDHQRSVVEAATRYLVGTEIDANTMVSQDRMILAHAILTALDPDAIQSVSGERWLAWLPRLLAAPGAYRVTRTALRASVEASRDRADQILINALGDHAAVTLIEGHESPAVSAAALTRAQTVDLNPYHLRALLDRAQRFLPDEAAAVALDHIRQRPANGSPEERAAMPWFQRAVNAAVALAGMSSFGHRFIELLDELRSDQTFARAVVLQTEQAGGQSSWEALTADQLAELYLWAHDVFPPSAWSAPGVVVAGHYVEDFADHILGKLSAFNEDDSSQIPEMTQQRTVTAANALDHLADLTGNVWIRQRARKVRDIILSGGPVATPSEILTAVDNSGLRVVTAAEQLFGVILEAVDDLAADLATDRALRALLWHRQRDGGQFTGKAVPKDETELSDWLSRELRVRLRNKVALFREVEVQPRLGATGKDVPDLIAIALNTNSNRVEVIIEVKCNWNDGLTAALEDQLGKRYLRGPHGRVGLYLVGFFRGDSWAGTDPRRTQATKRKLDELVELLNAEAGRLQERDVTVHVRVLDLLLDEQP